MTDTATATLVPEFKIDTATTTVKDGVKVIHVDGSRSKHFYERTGIDKKSLEKTMEAIRKYNEEASAYVTEALLNDIGDDTIKGVVLKVGPEGLVTTHSAWKKKTVTDPQTRATHETSVVSCKIQVSGMKPKNLRENASKLKAKLVDVE